jgi:hypothetical protein
MKVRHFGEFLLGNTPLQAQFTQSLSEDNPRACFSHDCDGKALPSYLSTHDTLPHDNVLYDNGRSSVWIEHKIRVPIGATDMAAAAKMLIAPVVRNDACEIRGCASVFISAVIVRIPTL